MEFEFYRIAFGLGVSLRHFRLRLGYSPFPLAIAGRSTDDRNHNASLIVSWIP